MIEKLISKLFIECKYTRITVKIATELTVFARFVSQGLLPKKNAHGK